MDPAVDEISRLFQTGLELMAKSDHAGAEKVFRRALQLNPSLAEAQANLGLLQESGGRREEAEESYRRALELDPGLVQTRVNLGALLAAGNRHAEAEETYRRALGQVPEHPGALSNLGVSLTFLQRETEAERCYRAALAAAPEHRSAAFNLGSLLLRQGQYEEGWRRLEARDWHSPLEGYLDQFPRWQGESLEGKSILVAAEGGHGDMIQFCRYLAVIKNRGAARVSVFCHPGLGRLFTRLEDADEILTSGSVPRAGGWDYWTLPLSLPHLLHTTLESIPAKLPYLSADPKQVAEWSSILEKPLCELGVGLVWKGNQNFAGDASRSLKSFSVLAPLIKVRGVRFFGLQKNSSGEVETVGEHSAVVDLGPKLHDFADTAAVVANLDLIITVDTAVAHLAGALGKPCWVMLSDSPAEWRWLKDRADSPWYPKVMRLFRQKEPGDWAPVIVEVGIALEAIVSDRNLE